MSGSNQTGLRVNGKQTELAEAGRDENPLYDVRILRPLSSSVVYDP